MKINQAAESLAKTDDMLAVLGVIMLLGVIISAYGSFWQGRLASAQFKQECSANPTAQDPATEKKKTLRYTIIITASVVLILAIMVYIFRKQFKAKITGEAVVA